MANRNVFLIATVASVDTVNAAMQYSVWALGPGNLGVRLSADGQEPATHICGYWAGCPEEQAIKLQQLCDGVVPDAADGYAWGEDGLPSEQDIIDACALPNLRIDSAAGEVNYEAHRNGVLTSMGLMRIIEEV